MYKLLLKITPNMAQHATKIHEQISPRSKFLMEILYTNN